MRNDGKVEGLWYWVGRTLEAIVLVLANEGHLRPSSQSIVCVINLDISVNLLGEEFWGVLF